MSAESRNRSQVSNPGALIWDARCLPTTPTPCPRPLKSDTLIKSSSSRTRCCAEYFNWKVIVKTTGTLSCNCLSSDPGPVTGCVPLGTLADILGTQFPCLNKHCVVPFIINNVFNPIAKGMTVVPIKTVWVSKHFYVTKMNLCIF